MSIAQNDDAGPGSAPTAPIALLFVPGHRPDRFEKAEGSGADVVILDLEDAVAPAAKEQARTAVAAVASIRRPILVRVNAVGTAWHAADVDMLAASPTFGAMLPKAESAGDIASLRARIGPERTLIAIVESAHGLAALAEIARAGVDYLSIGTLDLAVDLNCQPSWDAMLLARSSMVLQSRLAGLPPPIDGVTPQFSDPCDTEAAARQARALGFGGKLAIHPRQIAPIHAAFRPSDEEIAWARRALAIGGCDGAVTLEGTMIDKPVLMRAQRILGTAQEPSPPPHPILVQPDPSTNATGDASSG